ncbi:MAG: helix-turn-helix domain containing protein, partial [Deltaproteobacteria bacterium]|nr:helix-turn-helix domain containing protein [Deltaproteobacteria bacterium]
MGRPKEFDEHDALMKAMRLFWIHGYKATSIQDLVDGMGIGRGSLYGTFGGKRSLFMRALRYYDQERADLFKELSASKPPRQAVLNP